MKQKTGRKLLGFLLALAMVVGLMPGMGLTAYAATSWSESFTTNGGTIDGGVTVSGSITLTIPEGKTLTVNGGINASGNTLTVAGTGTLVVNGANGTDSSDGWGGIGGSAFTGNLIVNGATVNATGGTGGTGGNDDWSGLPGGNGGAGVDGSITVQGGSALMNGGSGGNGGQHYADPGGNGSPGKAVTGTITGSAQHSDNGNSWSAISGTTSTRRYVKVTPSHTHVFTYSVSGATITATCGAQDCTLTDSKTTLTLTAPTLTTYGEAGKSASATLTGLADFNTATGKTVAATDIKYAGRDDTTYAESATAPTNAGKYTAKITLSGVKTSAGEGKSVTASVDYEIAKAATTVTTVPTADEITYGKTLADSSLTGGTASVAGTFAWKDTTIVPAVSDSQKTEYDVVFTPTDENYGAAECKVKLTVNKADSAVTTAPTAKTLTYNGSAQSLINAGTASGGTMKYAVTTANQEPAAEAYTFDNTSIPTATNAGTYHVWYKVAGDANHNDTDPSCVTATIAEPAPTPTPTPKPTVARVARPSTQASPSKGTIAVSWKAAEGAKSYQVQWRAAGASKWTTKSVKGRKYTITGLKRGTLYQVRVRGVSGAAKGDWSKASSRWLKAASRVKATSGSKSGTVRVSWAKDAKANAGCRVYVYARQGGKPIKTIEVAKGKAAATIKGLRPGKTYYVRVRPYRKSSGTTYAGTISGYRTVRAAR